MWILFPNLKKPSLFVTVVFLASVSIVCLGLVTSSGMHMNEKGEMTGCLFDGNAAICTMTFVEHIQAWQNTFIAAQPLTKNLLAVLVVLFAGAAVFGYFVRFQYTVPKLHSVPLRVWRERNNLVKLFHHILKALREGILNPRVYKVSHVVR